MDNNFNTPQNDFNQTTVNNDSMQPNSNPYVQSNDAAFTQQWWGGTFVLNGDNVKVTKITLL